MKKQTASILVIMLLFLFDNRIIGSSLKEIVIIKSYIDFNNDSIVGEKPYRIIKINPFQVFFSEIPVSYEIFLHKKLSLQFQLGYIFPLNKKSHRGLFESMGTEGEATTEGFFSYRRSPYNNHGLSSKIEIREYGRHTYFAQQLMYKHCFYKESTFTISEGGTSRDQTESKFSNIVGFGLIVGTQSYAGNFVFDWYGGVGLRNRFMSVHILKIEYTRSTQYPDKWEYFNSVYPFINLGLRIGIKM
jgi:hypothetical protein